MLNCKHDARRKKTRLHILKTDLKYKLFFANFLSALTFIVLFLKICCCDEKKVSLTSEHLKLFVIMVWAKKPLGY